MRKRYGFRKPRENYVDPPGREKREILCEPYLSPIIITFGIRSLGDGVDNVSIDFVSIVFYLCKTQLAPDLKVQFFFIGERRSRCQFVNSNDRKKIWEYAGERKKKRERERERERES